MGFNSAKLSCVRQFNFASLIRLQKTAYPARAEAEMTAAIAGAGHEVKIDLEAHLDEIRWLVAGLSALNTHPARNGPAYASQTLSNMARNCFTRGALLRAGAS